MTPKRWLVLGSGLGIVAGAAWGVHRYAPTPTERTGAKERAPASGLRSLGARSDDDDARRMRELLADPSPSAWAELVSRYPGSDDETKRLVLERISKLERFERMLEYVLATVGEDPTPAEDDPMVQEAGELIEHRVKTPADFDYARRKMVMQKTDKQRWVVANALTEFAKDLGPNNPFAPLKGQLVAKFIDVHSETTDAFVKDSLVDAVKSLGETDAALILAEGPSVRDEDLQGVSEKNAAREQALRGASAP
jgi:hypothetical protein